MQPKIKFEMKEIRKRGISTTVAAAVIVIVVIIAAAGWGVYFASPITKTLTGSAGATQTITQTVTQTASQGTGTASSTTSQSSASSSATISAYLPETTSNTSFTIVGFTTAVAFANWYVVQQQGFAKHYIPNAKFTSLAGAQIAQALVSGQAQIGFSDPTSFIANIAQGAPVKLVSDLIVQPEPWAVLVAANSSYTTLSQLHGKTFTANTVGSTIAYLTQYILNEQLNWKINTDYQITGLGSSAAQQAAVLSGSAQALVQSMPTAYENLLSGHFRSIYNFTLPYPTLALYSTSSFIQQHPDAVRATILAFLQAAVFWTSNSTAAINLLENTYKNSPAAAQFNYATTYYSTDGYISIKETQASVNVLYSAGAINQNISALSFISPEFVPVVY